ncbi:MAG: hypothetical protein RR332_03475 [Clostridiales bacterium]
MPNSEIFFPLSLNLYTYCFNNPLIYWDPMGHVVTQADIDRAYKNNPPEKAKAIIKGLEAATDKWNNAKPPAEKAAAHAEADKLRGVKTNSNGSLSEKGGNKYVYLANPKTAFSNLIDKNKSNTSFSGSGTGKSEIKYDSAIDGKTIVLQEKVDYYIINGAAYLYNSVDTRMVVDLAAYRKSTGTIEAEKFVSTLKDNGVALRLPGTVNSQMVYSNTAVKTAYDIYVNQTTKFGDIYNGSDGRQHYTDFDKYGPLPPGKPKETNEAGFGDCKIICAFAFALESK